MQSAGGPAQYRKKPVVIEAMQYDGTPDSRDAIGQFGALVRLPEPDGSVEIWNSKEQCYVRCPMSHWVIKGIDGEFYPCDPDIFSRTYDPVWPDPA